MYFTAALASRSFVKNAGIIFTKQTVPKNLYPTRLFGTTLQRQGLSFIPKQKVIESLINVIIRSNQIFIKHRSESHFLLIRLCVRQ